MTDLARLEAEVEASRARLQGTISQIQDKLTLSGMVDELVGPASATRLADGRTFAQSILTRHPIPLLIAAAGIGFLIHRKKNRDAGDRLAAKDSQPASAPADGRDMPANPSRQPTDRRSS